MKDLETKRLILRKFKYSDLEGMYNNWCSDELVTPYVLWSVHKNIEETRTYLDKWIKEYELGFKRWIVELKETGEVIGGISVAKDDSKNKLAEVGYAYGSKYWGLGYATEALKALLKYLLEDYDIVVAKYIRENVASGRVMEKAGMQYEGILRSRIINPKTLKREDLGVYSIMKNDL